MNYIPQSLIVRHMYSVQHDVHCTVCATAPHEAHAFRQAWDMSYLSKALHSTLPLHGVWHKLPLLGSTRIPPCMGYMISYLS